MTTIGYIFLDTNRDALIPLEQQRTILEEYALKLKISCNELLIEQSYTPTISIMERSEGARMLENVQHGDNILVVQSKWVLGTPKSAMSLLKFLNERGVSLHCVDLKGDIAQSTQAKLVSSRGIATLVYQLCEALSLGGSGNHGAAIRAGKARKKKEGKYLGGPVPFGWQVGDDDKLQLDHKQQALISEMRQLKSDRWSYRDIAIKMQQEQELQLSHEGIRRILLKNTDQKI